MHFGWWGLGVVIGEGGLHIFMAGCTYTHTALSVLRDGTDRYWRGCVWEGRLCNGNIFEVVLKGFFRGVI
jgi:hypothetical protein